MIMSEVLLLQLRDGRSTAVLNGDVVDTYLSDKGNGLPHVHHRTLIMSNRDAKFAGGPLANAP